VAKEWEKPRIGNQRRKRSEQPKTIIVQFGNEKKTIPLQV
jgi:hypothetical protein